MNLRDHRKRLLAIRRTREARHEGLARHFAVVRAVFLFWRALRKGYVTVFTLRRPGVQSGAETLGQQQGLPATSPNQRMN